jgi:hypothetical protein
MHAHAYRRSAHARRRRPIQPYATGTGEREAALSLVAGLPPALGIEEIFGWMKTVGGVRKLRHRGGGRVNWQFLFVAAYNLVRMRTLAVTG